MGSWWSLIDASLARILQPGGFHLANAGAALLALGIGLLLALLLRKAVATLSRLVGVDVVGRQLGIGNGRPEGRPSRILGALAYWFALLIALMIALDVLEVEGAVTLLQRGISQIPALLVALVILVIGLQLASFLGALSEGAARTVRMPMAGLVGTMVRLVIMGLVVLVTLEQLGLTGPMTSAGFLIVLGTVPLAAVLAFGLGGRELAENVLASQLLRAQFSRGEHIRFGETEGTILCIGPGHTRLETPDGTLVVPNSRLARESTLKRASDQAK